MLRPLAAGQPPGLAAGPGIEVAPDRAQLPVRIRALHDGKLLYMAAPKLATPDPFYLLDPHNLPVPPTEAANRMVAARIAPGISISQMRPIDLIVCGSVAVNERGARLGKGAGYSDIEAALLSCHLGSDPLTGN